MKLTVIVLCSSAACLVGACMSCAQPLPSSNKITLGIKSLENMKLINVIWDRSSPRWNFDAYIFVERGYLIRSGSRNEQVAEVVEIAPDKTADLIELAKMISSNAHKRPPFPPPGPSAIVLNFEEQRVKKVSYLETVSGHDNLATKLKSLNTLFAESKKSNMSADKLKSLIPPDWFK
jgi:hypothetical protein